MASQRPLPDQATLQTPIVWSSKLRIAAPVAASQSRKVRSALPEAMRLPSGDQATLQTGPVCPSPCQTRAPSRVQTLTRCAPSPVASSRPSGDQATLKAVPPTSMARIRRG